MAPVEYTHEQLLAKKYNELLRISKTYGIKSSKRLKTEKLVEAILKCQEEEAAFSLSQDAAAVADAVDRLQQREEGSEEEEMLLDIQLPDYDSREEESMEVEEKAEDSACTNKTSEAKSRANEHEKDASSITSGDKTHKRSGTYDVEEEEEEKKRGRKSRGSEAKRKRHERASTYDLSPPNAEATPSQPAVNEQKTEENTKQLHLLTQKITVQGSCKDNTHTEQSPAYKRPTRRSHAQNRLNKEYPVPKKATRQSTMADKVTIPQSSESPVNTKGDAIAAASDLSQTCSPSRPALLSSPWQSRPSLGSARKSLRTRRSMTVTPTPPAPAPPLRPPLQRTPSAPTTATTKPMFTLGRGETTAAEESAIAKSKGSTGIPRFMTYARRLKVPNFAKIHEQAFQRLEGLDDYVDKKRRRKETISSSSTKKPQAKEEMFQPTVLSVKNLNFNFAFENTTVGDNEVEPPVTSALDKSNKQSTEASAATSSKSDSGSSPKASSLIMRKTARTPRTAQKVARESCKLKMSPKSLAKPTKATSPKSLAKPTKATSPKSLAKPTKATSPKSLAKSSKATSPKSLAKSSKAKSPKSLAKPVKTTSPKSLARPTKATSPKSLAKPIKTTSPKSLAKPTTKATRMKSPKNSTGVKSIPKPSQSTVQKSPSRTIQSSSQKNAKKPSPRTFQNSSPQNTKKHSPGTVLKGKILPTPTSSKKVSSVISVSRLKENVKPDKQGISSPLPSKLPVPLGVSSPNSVRRRMQEYSKSLSSRGNSYIPHKGAVKPLHDRNTLKSMAQKKHKVKSSKEIREGQRNILKGVRLNKRFELQMANRGITM